MTIDTSVYEDAFNMLCGELLGEGVHRKVFACKLRPELVVKVEYGDKMRHFANVMEMQFWDANKYYAKVSDWLSPCEFMSPDGRILLQRRADKLPLNYKFPEKIPYFLTDLKRDNFGLIGDKLVCVDYAITISNPLTRLKKAEWW